MVIDSIIKFGEKVLDYFLSSSVADDTILFAIDDEIYNSSIFEEDSDEKQKFESQIKSYVRTNGLNFRNDEEIALALAAHQIKLAYDSKTSYQNADDDGQREKTINNSLKHFYFPEENLVNVLYQRYYESLSELNENLQDKLWKKIKEILEKNERHCIIPVGLKGRQREQKYINAQLVVFKSLKHYFRQIFYNLGISKDRILTREEFNDCIENFKKNDSRLFNKIFDETLSRLRTYASDNNQISFNYNQTILTGLLWNFYKAWDESEADFQNNGNENGYYQDNYINKISIELFDECDEAEAHFECETKLDFQNTGLNINNGIYYRLFSQLDEDWWQKDVESKEIPDFEPFVVLIEKDELNRFSKVNCEIYHGIDGNTNYLALKYTRKPADFFEKLPKNCVQQSSSTINLIGGVYLGRNQYLDVGIEKALPQMMCGNQKIEPSRIDEVRGAFKKFEFSDTN